MTVLASLDGVSKRYRMGAEHSNWRALVPGPWGESRSGDYFKALDDVSIEVHRGQAIGIVGENGAGKSTLLKVLAGIVRPTSGSVRVFGTTASVIELGVGFNPDLTGSENLRFAGSLFGATAADIEQRYEGIVDFAGLSDFMDMPVKRYSTGMKARLGFALVTSFEADLIILDEVLSVGDWAFQQKCLERIGELHRDGAAVVAVSHSHRLITQICEHAVLLEQGRVVAEGEPAAVIERYLGTEPGANDEDSSLPDLRSPDVPVPVEGSEAVGVRLGELELEATGIGPNDRLRLRVRVEVDEPVDAEIVMSIYTMGRAIFADPEAGPAEILRRPGRWYVTATTAPLPFAPGPFTVRVAVVTARDPDDFLQEHATAVATASAPFQVLGGPSAGPGLLVDTHWEVLPVDRGGSGRQVVPGAT